MNSLRMAAEKSSRDAETLRSRCAALEEDLAETLELLEVGRKVTDAVQPWKHTAGTAVMQVEVREGGTTTARILQVG